MYRIAGSLDKKSMLGKHVIVVYYIIIIIFHFIAWSCSTAKTKHSHVQVCFLAAGPELWNSLPLEEAWLLKRLNLGKIAGILDIYLRF